MSSNAYGALFRLSVVRWQVAAGLVAQMTQGAATVAIILIVRERTGSLALAGAVVSALWVAGGVARPLQGRLVDRQGATRVMAVCGVAHPAALASLVGLSHVQGLGWPLVLLGVFAGLALPPVSTSMRIEWAEIVSADERPAAYSLVYLTQELAILTGPLLLAAVIAASSASIALITIAALTALGTLAFAASIRTSSERRPSTSARASPLRAPGMQVLLAVALLLGGVIGAFQVAVATLAAAHRTPAAAGLLIATLSIGGVIGAAIYGTRRWRATPRWRLLFLLTLLTAPLALMTTTPSLVMIGVLVLFAGLPLNPALSTFSLLVDQYASPGSTGEAFGWLSTAIAAGTGGGSALAVVIAEHQHDPQAAFGAAALTGAAATALTFCLRRTLDQRSARTVP